MANISRIVNVQISLNTAGISSDGFSTMMVVGDHAYTPTRVLSVTDSDELLEIGFKSTDAIYRAVVDAFSQTPRPKQVKVGRLQCSGVRVGLVGDVAVGNVYSGTVKVVNNGETEAYPFTYTAVEDDAVANVLEGLTNAFSANGLTADVVGLELAISASNPYTSFGVELNGLLNLNSVQRASAVDMASNMGLIASADSDFYGIVLASRDRQDILDMADWCEAHTKLFGFSTDEEGAKDAEVDTDILSVTKNGNYFRTFGFYHADAATDYPEAAVMARCFAVYPGGETWANKRLAGVTTDKLSENEYQAITKKNGNSFEPFRNVSVTQNGKVAAGEWIDVIRFRDWLVETIQTEEFSMLINRDKLPYTDGGIAMVETVLGKVLALGQKRGGIAPTEYDEDNNKNLGYTISVPLASEISANVKAQRVLQDVTFTARLAGAIHAVEIKGSLTYENLIVG